MLCPYILKNQNINIPVSNNYSISAYKTVQYCNIQRKLASSFFKVQRPVSHVFKKIFKNLLFIYKFIYFIYLFLAALGPRCCVRASSSCSERGLLFVTVRRLSHCSGFSCCGTRALGARASVVVARRFSSCGVQTQ